MFLALIAEGGGGQSNHANTLNENEGFYGNTLDGFRFARECTETLIRIGNLLRFDRQGGARRYRAATFLFARMELLLRSFARQHSLHHCRGVGVRCERSHTLRLIKGRSFLLIFYSLRIAR